ncbi:MAG: Fur family transcriptional regulator [Acidimicrobiales bacterium]
MKTPDDLTSLFRSKGRKVTPQRQCIFRALQGNDSHPSAEAIYAAVRVEMETISLKTVYQTLNELAEMGEIAILDVGRGAARFDPNARTHHHLVCERCGRVRDLEADFSFLSVPAGQDQGFAITGAEVVFRGLCQECGNSGNSGNKTIRSREKEPAHG